MRQKPDFWSLFTSFWVFGGSSGVSGADFLKKSLPLNLVICAFLRQTGGGGPGKNSVSSLRIVIFGYIVIPSYFLKFGPFWPECDFSCSYLVLVIRWTDPLLGSRFFKKKVCRSISSYVHFYAKQVGGDPEKTAPLNHHFWYIYRWNWPYGQFHLRQAKNWRVTVAKFSASPLPIRRKNAQMTRLSGKLFF